MKKSLNYLIILLLALFIGINISKALAIPGNLSYDASETVTEENRKKTIVTVKFTASETTTLSGNDVFEFRFNRPSELSSYEYVADGDVAAKEGIILSTVNDGGEISGGRFIVQYSGNVEEGQTYELFKIALYNDAAFNGSDLGGTFNPSNQSFITKTISISNNTVTENLYFLLNTSEYSDYHSHSLEFIANSDVNINKFNINVSASGSELYSVQEDNTITYNIPYGEGVSKLRLIKATVSYPIAYYFEDMAMTYSFNSYIADEPTDEPQGQTIGYMGIGQKTYLDTAHYGFGSPDSYIRYNEEEDTYTMTLSFTKNPEDWNYPADVLDNLPQLKAIRGIITPFSQGVEIIEMISDNGEFNKYTGAFEADFDGEPIDLVFTVKINNFSAIEDSNTEYSNSDIFTVSVHDISYVADGYLANEDIEYTANQFSVLFLYRPIVLGDWNDDDELNLVDIVRYRMYLANVEKYVNMYNALGEVQKHNLDFNKDGELNLSDLIYARKVIVGLISCQGSTCVSNIPI